MTQASHVKPESKPTTSPAPNGTTVPTVVAAGSKPEDKPATANTTEAAPAVKKGSSRIFIATGPVHEFETTAKAEKFLNGGGETPAPADYVVLRGKRIGTSKKVSLR